MTLDKPLTLAQTADCSEVEAKRTGIKRLISEMNNKEGETDEKIPHEEGKCYSQEREKQEKNTASDIIETLKKQTQ